MTPLWVRYPLHPLTHGEAPPLSSFQIGSPSPRASNRKSHSSLQNKSGDSLALLLGSYQSSDRRGAVWLSGLRFCSSLFSLLTFLC